MHFVRRRWPPFVPACVPVYFISPTRQAVIPPAKQFAGLGTYGSLFRSGGLGVNLWILILAVSNFIKFYELSPRYSCEVLLRGTFGGTLTEVLVLLRGNSLSTFKVLLEISLEIFSRYSSRFLLAYLWSIFYSYRLYNNYLLSYTSTIFSTSRRVP